MAGTDLRIKSGDGHDSRAMDRSSGRTTSTPYRSGQTSMISGTPTTTTMIDNGRPRRQ